MGLLEVEPVGLQTLARRIESSSIDVGEVLAPESQGMPCQATATAVEAMHTAISNTGATLAARMRSTAAKLATAGSDYTNADRDSAASFRELIVGI